MMNCQEAALFIERYMDREISGADMKKLEEHIHKCSDCFGHIAFDRALKSLLRKQMIQEELSPGIKELILKKLKKSD